MTATLSAVLKRNWVNWMNNNIEVSKIPDVNWQKFYNEPLRVTHAFKNAPRKSKLYHPDSTLLEGKSLTESRRFKNNQIEKRKRMIAGLVRSIKAWEQIDVGAKEQ